MDAKNDTMISHEEGVELKDISQQDRDDASSINSEAIGDNLPPGYFRSWRFIGAFTGFCLAGLSAYLFLILPTNIISYISADLGGSEYISWVSHELNPRHNNGTRRQGLTHLLLTCGKFNIVRTLASSLTYTGTYLDGRRSFLHTQCRPIVSPNLQLFLFVWKIC